MANKDPNLINKTLLGFSNELIKELKILGKDFRIFEGYRSPEEQDKLFKAKKTTLKGGQSKHNKQPSEAVTIYEYKNNAPIYTGFIQSVQFRNLVNNLLLKYKGVSWGGNFKNAILGHFEIIPQTRPVEVNPAPIPPQQIKPVTIVPPEKPVKIIPDPKPIIQPTPLVPGVMIEPKPTPAKIIPAAVKVEVDNSTLIVVGLGLAAYLYLRK